MDVLPKGVWMEHYRGLCAVHVALPGSGMDSTGMVDGIRLRVLEAGEDKAVGETVGKLYAIARRARAVADALRQRQRNGNR
jgi:hypothetical protein